MTPEEIKAATTAPETRNAPPEVGHYETKGEAEQEAIQYIADRTVGDVVHVTSDDIPEQTVEDRMPHADGPADPTSTEDTPCDCPLCQLERAVAPAQIMPIPLSVVVNIMVDICTKENARWDHDPVTGEPIERNFGEMIALAHGELSEALEGHRKDLDDPHLPEFKNVDVELADAVIRICHLAGLRKIDLGAALVAKLRYNRTREDHTNEARQAPGGKRF
jgi:NTP pyrophosphatase (non-canonical NTP hydrolase)